MFIQFTVLWVSLSSSIASQNPENGVCCLGDILNPPMGLVDVTCPALLQVVRMAKEMEWISTVSYIPMLRYSILSPLLSEYFPDGVGISPTTVKHVSRSLVVQAMSESSGGGGQPGELDKKSPNGKCNVVVASSQASSPSSQPLFSPPGPVPLPALLCDPLHPFNHPQEGPRARAFTPDIMEPEEIRTFPEYYRWVEPYCGHETDHVTSSLSLSLSLS